MTTKRPTERFSASKLPRPSQRPAEFTAVAASIALLIGTSFGLDDPNTITAIAVVIGFIPTAVTSIVVWNRRRKADEL